MKTAATQNKKHSLGRHPLLKSGLLTKRVFTALKLNPGLTIPELASRLTEIPQSVNGALQRMKAEGLVIGQPAQKGNRVTTVYRPVIENEGGFARDKVEFEVTVYVNDYGEYSIKAKVTDESPLSYEGNPQPIHSAKFYVAVPKPSEPTKTRQIFHAEDAQIAYTMLLDLTKVEP